MEKTQALISLKAFLPKDQEVLQIVEFCRLVPAKTWRQWTDQMGNILSIHKNRKCNIIQKKDCNFISDLYYKAPPKTIANKTKTALLLISPENEMLVLCSLGQDERLRIIRYNRGWLSSESPLTYGLNNLKIIVRIISSGDISEFQKIILPGNVKPSIGEVGPIAAVIQNVKQTLQLANSSLTTVVSELI